ncbi:YdcF family protein [Spirulina subsalsa FACHB-351]|uniref:YdcF family protein n=1 Tax=Spirulina subsalsa FACHB-351 TaxID=234711 RepID=A0ABT3L1Q2_9CYAN|nr:YdcF family protein [Spirulina subsalsa]MCW6035426.1 YdcF family protein [Spirulina subsalsa FACHB-351]
MFLYLSKLLPIFIYPIGLTCVLLVVAFVLGWRQSRWTPLPLALAFLLLMISGNGWVNSRLVSHLEWQHIPPAELPQADAIVVLGGALKPKLPPRPMINLSDKGDRVIYAAQLYRDGKAPLIIASGGRIDWLGQLPPESEDTAQFLQMLGVPPEAIIQESRSLNTHQNAIFTREILIERGLKRILLVTSALHMPRSYLIFQRQGIETIPAPTDFLATFPTGDSSPVSFGTHLLSFLPDTGRVATTTEALKEYIGLLVYRLRGWL